MSVRAQRQLLMNIAGKLGFSRDLTVPFDAADDRGGQQAL
jgi:hypothetical protein